MKEYVVEIERTIIETYSIGPVASQAEAESAADDLMDDGQIWNLPQVGHESLDSEIVKVREAYTNEQREGLA
jgi:hypothetical protein